MNLQVATSPRSVPVGVSDDTVRRYDIPAPRYTSYPTAPMWTKGFDREAYGRQLDELGRSDASQALSLYVHIPFCRERCTFCGCNVVATRDTTKPDSYLDHVGREMELVASRLGPRRNLSQIHWGGGTPTFLGSRQITRLWKLIETRFRVMPDAEVSVEVNPAVTVPEQISVLKELGFNRVSMGVQDLDPRVQSAINRNQSVEDTRQLLEQARSLGFTGINFDLIYGLPYQSAESWAQTLNQVIAMRPDRLAIYSFAFVPDVRPNQKRIPAEALPRGRAKLDLLLRARERLTDAGYRPIGMDHFALPSDELARAQSKRALGRNFQGYTVRSATNVVAFGITAISDVAGAYAQNVRQLARYYALIDAGHLATERGYRLSPDDQRRRAIIESLFCNFWVDLGPDASREFAVELAELQRPDRSDLVRIRGNEVELTPLGQVFVRNVAMVFDSYLRRPDRPAFSRTV